MIHEELDEATLLQKIKQSVGNMSSGPDTAEQLYNLVVDYDGVVVTLFVTVREAALAAAPLEDDTKGATKVEESTPVGVLEESGIPDYILGKDSEDTTVKDIFSLEV